MELDDSIYEKIKLLSREGDRLFNLRKYDDAIYRYEEALELLPGSKMEWAASLWLYTAIGDSFFMKKKYQKALSAFYDAYNSPDAIDNPFVNLRLGQCLFELNQIEKAEDFLMRAYMLNGVNVFKGDGSKYLAYMRKKFDL